MRPAILPGTYDPITCGHTSLAVRAAALFGRAVVVVMNNTEKRTLFSFDQRLELARAAFPDRTDIEVVGCEGRWLISPRPAETPCSSRACATRAFCLRGQPRRNQPAARRRGDAPAARRSACRLYLVHFRARADQISKTAGGLCPRRRD